MFGYRSNVPKVRLTTDRLVVRLVHDRDAWRLADYYAENKAFLKPWEPVRDDSHCYPSGWQARLSMISEFHKQGLHFISRCSIRKKKRSSAWRIFPTWCAGRFMPAISATPLARSGRGRG
jgi:ribosomal-protein-alanine N-acetyltransferase